MGNAALGEMVRPRPAVEERLTRPQRLVRQLSDLDSGRLRRLIRSGDLAPCFDSGRLRRLIRSGDLAPCFDADDDERAVECPICFYFYPSLNRSKCCGKGICTECFLQLMPSKASKAVHNAAALSAKPQPTPSNIVVPEPQVRRNFNKKKNRTLMRLKQEYEPKAQKTGEVQS